jgi:hypothetical protein
VSRDGTICPGTERGTERYARGRNEGRNGTEWNETERGAERNDNIEKRKNPDAVSVLSKFFQLQVLRIKNIEKISLMISKNISSIKLFLLALII